MNHSTVLILDYGSQYTRLIARRIRELGIFSIIKPGDASLEKIKELSPSAIILSGGPSSVYDSGAPTLPKGLMEYRNSESIPLLGICYGMQLLVHELGGKVDCAESREYGRMRVQKLRESKFFSPLPAETFEAWMSHGDEIKTLPPGFVLTAESKSRVPAGMENAEQGIYALQFHPEVTHTEHGLAFLKNFLTNLCEIKPDWKMGSIIEEQIEKIRAQVGPTDHAICALSGGVDSTVAAVLVHRALGDRLHCVFVDHGLLRYQEQERVMKMFQDHLHLPVTCVDASERFLSELAGVSDPEKKRKIIGAEFIEVFDQSAQGLEKKLGFRPKYLVQGTLYPDVIESSPPPSSVTGENPTGFKHSATIKSHHNVGGLPEKLNFKLVEPLRDLFKDEVRVLGKELGIPETFLKRHPFPGPGLAVRVLGEITRPHLDVLRKVDEVFIQALHEYGLYDEIWQAFAVFLPIRSVGVQGDGRTHDHVVGLRAVTSKDGMTADWYPFKPDFLAEVSSRICNQVAGVNRVVYDISSKPPATIEWE